MRRTLSRESYLPKHPAAVVRSKRADAVAYLIDDGRRPAAMCFAGKAAKPAAHYSFRDAARRAAFVADWIAQQEAAAAARVDRRAQRRAFVHTLAVGDIMQTSWGYDQTNVEFFEVVALVGRSMVEVREIAQQREETGYMQGLCVPVAGQYIGESQRKRVLPGNSLDMHGGFGYAHKVERITVAPGVQVCDGAPWSSYA